jgi:hypothetical protein
LGVATEITLETREETKARDVTNNNSQHNKHKPQSLHVQIEATTKQNKTKKKATQTSQVRAREIASNGNTPNLEQTTKRDDTKSPETNLSPEIVMTRM